MDKRIRQPIVAVLGHVDHGKTTLLDKIRGSAIAAKEAGGITQHIGATEVPINIIKKICGELLKNLKKELIIPGLLFIDTPGHEAFSNLRKRGGALADIAVLVIDINEGFKPQTTEALEILKAYKTPFVCALNKIDLIPFWKAYENMPFSYSFRNQEERAKDELEKKLYSIVGELAEHGFESERFDRVKRFERQVSLIPVSGVTGEGIPELLMVISGLAQKFLERKLEIDINSPGAASVLEIKETRGLGSTADILLYDGVIRRGDTIVVGGKEKPVITRVKAILKPKALDEIRDPRFKFKNVSQAHAACGIKIAAPELENAVAGSLLYVVRGNIDDFVKKIETERERITVKTDKVGVVVKADTLGSLEAIVNILKTRGIAIRLADIGEVNKRDVMEARIVREKDEEKSIILAFNAGISHAASMEAEKNNIRIITGNVIYRLLEDYDEYIKNLREERIKKEFENLILPAKIKLLPHAIFRHSKPAIVGIEVLAGKIKPKYRMINEKGEEIGYIREIQDKGNSLSHAEEKMQVAVSIENAAVGRNLNENDILYTNMPKEHVEIIEKKFYDLLTENQKEVLEEVKRIKGIVLP